MSGRFASYLLCILLWLRCSYELVLIAIRAFTGHLGNTPLIGSLLTQPRPVDRAAPVLILLILGWIHVELVLHLLRVLREWRAAEVFRVAVKEEAPLKGIPGTTRAGRRAALFMRSASTGHLHDVVSSAAAVEASAVDNAYSVIRVFIWILPVVGFIGTALGMSHSIAGFGDALKEGIDVKDMTARLSQLVIPGLASAFSTTILALASAIVAHLCASTLQAAEHSTLDSLDQSTVQRLAYTPMRAPSTSNAGSESALLQAIQKLGDANLQDAATQMVGAASALKSAAGAMRQAADAPYHVTVKRGE